MNEYVGAVKIYAIYGDVSVFLRFGDHNNKSKLLFSVMIVIFKKSTKISMIRFSALNTPIFYELKFCLYVGVDRLISGRANFSFAAEN